MKLLWFSHPPKVEHKTLLQMKYSVFISHLQTCLKRIRLDLPIVHEDFKNNEGMLSLLLFSTSGVEIIYFPSY